MTFPSTHNMDVSYRVTAEELRQFIERVESLEVDKKAIADDIKEVFAEAKGRGYATKVLRLLIRERKRDADDLAEEESLLEMYREAVNGVLSDI